MTRYESIDVVSEDDAMFEGPLGSASSRSCRCVTPPSSARRPAVPTSPATFRLGCVFLTSSPAPFPPR